MINTICLSGHCTACGACENICPKKCIIRQKNASSITLVKGDGCVDCGLCERVCPSNKQVNVSEKQTAYIASSTDKEMLKKSASGGIASAFYKFFLDKGYYVVGAELDSNYECKLKISNKISDIEKFRNSKYTYSFAGEVYKEVKTKLNGGEGVFFVGLPCQVAALKSYLDTVKANTEKLVTADIICHGTPQPDYFKQHVETISKKLKDHVNTCYFRDSRFGTNNFVLSLYNDSQKLIYSKFVEENDMYQVGYHSALIYRDSCYSCNYAQINRSGDLTFGDYHAIRADVGDFDIEKKSLILVNTEVGRRYINELLENKIITMQERPLSEPYNGEPQLRHPSIAGKERIAFLNNYEKYHDYDRAAKPAFMWIAIRKWLKIDKIKRMIKDSIKKIFPKKLYEDIKTMAKRGHHNY